MELSWEKAIGKVVATRLRMILERLEWRTVREDKGLLPGYQPSVAALSPW